MKVLHVVNLFPSESKPDYGIFIKEQIDSLEGDKNIANDLYYIDVDTHGPIAYWLAIKALRVRVAEYDIVHAHHVFSAFTVILAGAARKMVVSYLTDKSDVKGWLRLGGPFFYYFTLLLSRKAIQKTGPAKGIFRNKIAYIPNGVNMEFFKPIPRRTARAILGLNENDFVVLFISSNLIHRPEKRRDLFERMIKRFEAARTAKTRVVPVYLCNQNRESMRNYYCAANAYVLVSDREGSPNTVKEALACGCPVLVRDVGDTSFLVSDMPFTCLIGNPDDVDSDVAMKFLFSLEDLTDLDRLTIRKEFENKRLDQQSIASKLKSLYSAI